MDFSINDFNVSLCKHMKDTASAALHLKHANASLAKLTGTSYVRFHWENLLDAAMDKWLEPICEEITRKYSGETGNRLTVSGVDKELKEIHRLVANKSLSGAVTQKDITSIVEEMVSRYPFHKLKEYLENESYALETRGFTKIADNIADKLCLRCYRNGRAFFKETKRHISFDLSINLQDYGSFDYRTREKFHEIASGIRFIDEQVGNVGLATPFEELAKIITNNEAVSGRTFGNVNSLQLKGFNQHIRVSMTPDVMDALMAFLVCYTSEHVNLKQPEHSSTVAA